MADTRKVGRKDFGIAGLKKMTLKELKASLAVAEGKLREAGLTVEQAQDVVVGVFGTEGGGTMRAVVGVSAIEFLIPSGEPAVGIWVD
jgi:hypothetical protein